MRALTYTVFAALFAFAPLTAAKADTAAARELVAAAEKEDWKAVARIAPRVQGRLVQAYADWLDYQQRNTDATFEEIAFFLEEHPSWPRRTELRRAAERAVDGTQSGTVLIEWFGNNPPVTGEGALAYLDALSGAGATVRIPELARTYWVARNFDAGTEQKFLRKYGRHITEADHIARLDRLIWARSHTAAWRMLRRVDPDQAALGTARIALSRQSPGVDAAIAKVPAGLRNDPALQFERLRWRRKKDKDLSAADLYHQHKGPRPAPEMWALEGRILARRALENGQHTEAARLAAGHRLKSGGGFAASEFLAGWVRLALLGQPNAAGDHFDTLYSGVSFPISRARGAYWKARAAAARGNAQLAAEWYERAAAYPTTFYGQEAARMLGRPLDRFEFATPTDPLAREEFLDRELVQLVQRLHELGADKRLRTFLLHLAGLAESAEERLLVAQLAHESDRPREAIRAIKRLSQLDNKVGIAGYPTVNIPGSGTSHGAPDALVLAVIRQESGFDRTAISRADARGMMQLLPGTAKRVAKDLSLPYKTSRLTVDPQYNIRLGRTYLSQMLERFAGSVPLALAAYNAGPHRVDRWLQLFGDPRTGQIDMIDWMESIPFAETRNYVQRVTEAQRVYEYLLDNAQVAEVGAVPLRRAQESR